jgi:60 kDa SS-A/Ro ribonucleoprotein
MKYNTKKSTISEQPTVNRAGGEAYKMTSLDKAIQILSTLLIGEDKYYGDVMEEYNACLLHLANTDPEMVLKLACAGRNIFDIRTASIYTLVKASNLLSCKPFVRKWTPSVVMRADELAEAIGCHMKNFSVMDKDEKGNPVLPHKKGSLRLPNSLKKGLGDTFNYFTEFELSRYKGDNNTITLKDVMCLTHPQRTDLTKKIHDGTLEVANTWETYISKNGSNKDTWEYVIDNFWVPNEGKFVRNYMAIIRNLNNLDKVKISSSHWNKVAKAITNEGAILHSKMFPFRFFTAMKYNRAEDPFTKKMIEETLNKAMSIAVKNIPMLKGRTLIASDVSGSMSSSISEKSGIRHIDIAGVMNAMSSKFCENAISGAFGTYFKLVPKLTGDILSDVQTIVGMERELGSSTNGHLVVEYLNKANIKTDRIIIFTDMQLWNDNQYDTEGQSLQSEFNKYVAKYPDVKMYLVNLNGYGESPVKLNNKNVISISGWSDKMFKFIDLYEQGTSTLAEEIRKLVPVSRKPITTDE